MAAHTHTRKTPIAAPPSEVFAWHTRDGALARLSPPWEHAKIVKFEGIRNGQRAVLEVKAPFKTKWVAEHRDYIDGLQFRDVQVKGPFASWEHTHRVEPDPATGGRTTVMHDHVRYEMPYWLLGQAAHGWFVRDKIEQAFAYRHDLLKRDLEDHQQAAGRSLTVAITGSTGLVGSALSPYLTTGGHTVRPVPRAEKGVGWQANALSGADAVVHLAGEPVVQKWTPKVRRRIEESRVEGTRVLCEALSRLQRKPAVLVSASAVGYYGNRGDELLAEHDDPATPGKDFLADVAHGWENATKPAVAAGIRVVNLRIGLVLDPRGGALGQMLPLVRKGLGGKLGSGRQWMSWIGINDLLGVIYRAILDDQLTGPVNAVSPQPVTNAQFTKVLGRILGRPTVMPVPKFALKAKLGQAGPDLLLASQRVDNAALRRAKYTYRNDNLDACLRSLLGCRKDV